MTEEMLFATEDQQVELLTDGENIAEVAVDKYLIFVTDGLMMGVNAEYVVEIITNHMITPLPMVPGFVSGIINLRGQIIPIINIRLRLGKSAENEDCIVVINVDGTRIGILVDTVDQMVDVECAAVSAMPAQSAQELISGMCTLPDGHTMLVLDCPRLLHS